ncbi:hypothetical protein HQN87_22165 [Paenibacillus tritici]|uniref:DUF4306 domain-containing protein n=1 Tax=Paenibacillus tritici TaxID=1873425 RepID=A0ABX2DUH6_9BACL|nr:hypothetical protein [Paenibacillus tritici]NQX48035.1 hypothetical protein [Paenibacillus tritici]
MKKPLFRALITGLLFVGVYYGVQAIYGMYLTMSLAPDLADQYTSANDLQYKVTFGVADHPVWRIVEVFGLMLLGMIVYYTGRVLRRNAFKSHK